jgi:pyridoxamine 5'-phosphate oxidase
MSEINKVLANMRKDYASHALLEESADPNPFKQFKQWMDEVIKGELNYLNAMTLSTVSKDGFPSSRVVLLKSFDENGFTFYTNYESKKGIELDFNPKASLNFFWQEYERQVRLVGTVVRTSEKDSDEYFSIRPHESQIGTWASHQSSILESRNSLDERVIEFQKQFEGKVIPRPPYWGGFIVKPIYFEFWQGRPNRLHDRLSYTKEKSETWKIERLSP